MNACGCGDGGCQKLRHSEEAQDQTLVLPLFHQLSFEQQNRVVAALAAALGE